MLDEKELIDIGKLPEQIDKRFEEYKKFAFQGRIVETAIAFILGGAFGKVVSSLSEHIIMPFLSFIIMFTGKNWREIIWSPCWGLNFEIGKFTAASVDFLLISVVLFIMWKFIHQEKAKQAD